MDMRAVQTAKIGIVTKVWLACRRSPRTGARHMGAWPHRGEGMSEIFYHGKEYGVGGAIRHLKDGGQHSLDGARGERGGRVSDVGEGMAGSGEWRILLMR